MVGSLFGNVIAFRMIWEFPIAGERLAEDRVERFLDSSAENVSQLRRREWEKGLRRLDVPSTKVEFHHAHKSLHWIVNLWHWQERLWMCHEAIRS